MRPSIPGGEDISHQDYDRSRLDGAGRHLVYEALPGRVVFGPGTLERLGEEADRLGARRVLLVGSADRVERAAALLGDRVAGTFTEVVQHVPVEVAEDARALARQTGADALVAIGGGSPIGVAKAVAVELGLPVVAVPTTYSGSEMTPIYGLTSAGRKHTARDPRALPKVVIYDPVLTVGLPREVTGPSGMNALAHCVEALWAPGANPVTDALAEEGSHALAAGLPVAVGDPADLRGRGDALRGAWLAGTVLAAAGTGVHHRTCHVLGGAFALPHADTHAAVLPHATALVAPAYQRELARAARGLGSDVGDVAGRLWDLARDVGAPASLAELGLAAADLDEAARILAEDLGRGPRPLAAGDARALLAAAWSGERP